MERKIKDLSSWIEVTPALFISLRKTSNSPALETITEEETEETPSGEQAYDKFVERPFARVRTSSVVLHCSDCKGTGNVDVIGFGPSLFLIPTTASSLPDHSDAYHSSAQSWNWSF
ncbi:hypothetical protein SADUNF_Sadunf06G0104900 [Salix dunnii]|uniref:Uncharacterized protein n=1 Tax=Salix dunnii TaxID=1413687 RepID=A0A835K6J4_9ROSI|nr:hypothetical protein SADUNF_Sadunf06G0104900 [Salix dunnii]